MTVCVCMCVWLFWWCYTHPVAHRHAVRLVGVFCPGGAVSKAEAGTLLHPSQISLSALEQLCLCVD